MSDNVRVERAEGGGVPALEHRRNNSGHAAGGNGGDARVPGFGAADFRGGVADDGGPEALRRVDGEPLTEHAAKGKTAKGGGRNVEMVKKREDLAGCSAEGIGVRGDRGLAVTAGVEAKDAVGVLKCDGLRPTC